MFGTITTTLRPLKFAFLVHPSDHRGLRQAIELGTLLWGGQFNPIIPTYRRLPPRWRRSGRVGTAKSVFNGYLEAFDPDYVVPIGKIKEPPFPVGHRAVIDAKTLLHEFENTGTLGYGLGIFDILHHFVEEELRFTRRFPIGIVLPEQYKEYPLFLGSALGSLSERTESTLRQHWTESLGATWQHCEGHSYADLYDKDILFPRRLSSLFIEGLHRAGWIQRECVFVMDASSTGDIIDFWNLRAIGWNVIPAPVQFLEHASVRALAKGFIDDNFLPFLYDRSRYNKTTILNSENVGDEQVAKFVESLEIRPKDGVQEAKVVLQKWYPRVWDAWARRPDQAAVVHIEAETRSHDIAENRSSLRLRTLAPEFMSHVALRTKVAFANMIDLRVYGAKEMIAEVIPEGDDSLARAIGGIRSRAWRFSKSGMTYLSSHKDWSIHLEIPDAESVFVEWFRQNEWSVELSSAGRIAKRICLAVGGVWGLGTLTNEGIIKLLDKMSDGRNMKKEAFLGNLARIANERTSPVGPERLAKRVTDDRMFRLGVEVQCPVCTQRSWYTLEDINYRLQCMKCLERFDVPSHSPDSLAWSYRTFGPFSLPGLAQGAYAVLLTYYFFSRKFEGSTTPIMSFTAQKGQKELEADLGLFFNRQRIGRTATDLIFAECKSYGQFKSKDVERLCYLGAEFPGSVLVFATLRRSLTFVEKRMLRRVADRGRRYSEHDRSHNPVLVLTGIELFGHDRPPGCWEEEGDKFAEFAKGQRGYGGLLELCDCTQQLHLEMKPYYEWRDSRLERRLGRRS